MITSSLTDKKVLITCGPTWVAIDNVRVISNNSTGELGHLIACALKKEGARVHMLEGPVTHRLTCKINYLKKYSYYKELDYLVDREVRKGYYKIAIHAAAVSDYEPLNTYGTKIDSHFSNIQLNLVPTKKIITKFKELNPKIFLVGFKLEGHHDKKLLTSKAIDLLENAKCDLVVTNCTTQKKYTAFIIDKTKNIIAKVKKREDLAKELVKAIKERV